MRHDRRSVEGVSPASSQMRTWRTQVSLHRESTSAATASRVRRGFPRWRGGGGVGGGGPGLCRGGGGPPRGRRGAGGGGGGGGGGGVAGAAGFAALQAGGEFGELGLGLGQGLVEPAGLAGVQGW